MTEDERASAYAHGRCAMRQYQWLAQENLRLERCNYRCFPKSHFFDHTLRRLRTSRFNTYYHECWGEETLLGKLKVLHAKVHPRTALHRSLQRYRFRLVRELGIQA